MRRILSLFLLMFSILAAGSARAEPDFEGLNRALTEEVVVPALAYINELVERACKRTWSCSRP